MKITLRLAVALVVTVALVAGVSSYLNVRSERNRLTSALERQAWLVAEGLKEAVSPLVTTGPSKRLDRIAEKISTSKEVFGVVIYNSSGEIIAVSKQIKNILPAKLDIIFEKFEGDSGKGSYLSLSARPLYLYAVPLFSEEGERTGTVVTFMEALYIEKYLTDIWYRNFSRFLANALLITLITLLVIRWSITGPIAKMAEWMKEVRKGAIKDIFSPPKGDIFSPISDEISKLAKGLAMARAEAEEEARLRDQAESIWTRERLKEHVKARIAERRLIIVANREPFMHVKKGKAIEWISPASGLVTALDPILRACGGLWVAHGAGSADRETVDRRNIIRVPPDSPQYDLKRVWLTREEEQGYYYGFANEGLWPLCHIAHARPVFRVDDWARYQEVNLKFTRAIEEELTDTAFIFVQDYHFSLLPRIVKERNPQAKIALFWHIPWPNPEAFGICPWKREILHGMLGADLIGFHTQFHCNNFLETVDKTLECRTNWEMFSTTRMDHTTFVKPFPISVDMSPQPFTQEPPAKEELLKNLGLKAVVLGVGVDRADYTKGIVERFRAVERFLEKNPEYRGMFAFIQVAAPSREHIKRYQDLLAEVTAEANRINWKLQSGGWRPIVLIKEHLSHVAIEPYYKRADFCMVTSLHDGMNLVAKEFVASREDEQGVLILSTFTGASRELRDALLVNPYDIEQMADMIKASVEMDAEEQRLRMKRMRNFIRENNVYKWAADIISELSRIRTDQREE